MADRTPASRRAALTCFAPFLAMGCDMGWLSRLWNGLNGLSDDNGGSTFVSPLEGKPLRYLIGTDGPGPGSDDEITEVAYTVTWVPARGIAVKYCNLFDEENTGEYGPYLQDSETAQQYGEGQIDPRGPGWEKNLRTQMARAVAQGFSYIELDNPDAYRVRDVLGAYDMAAVYGLKVLGKNPLISDHNEDTSPLVRHGAVVGVVVERGAGDPARMHSLRKRVGKPSLPVWFVAFGNGRTWAREMAARARNYKNMMVTYSARGEYGSSEDVTG